MAATGGMPLLSSNISKELADKLKRRSGADQSEQPESPVGEKSTPPSIAKKPIGFNPLLGKKMPAQNSSPSNEKPTPPAVAKKPIGFNPITAQKTPNRQFGNDIAKELNAKLKIQSPFATPPRGVKLPIQTMRQNSDGGTPNKLLNQQKQDESVQYDKDGMPISSSPVLNHSAARDRIRVMPKKNRRGTKHLSLDFDSHMDQGETNVRVSNKDKSREGGRDRRSVAVSPTVDYAMEVDQEITISKVSKDISKKTDTKDNANTLLTESEDDTEEMFV
ncbi:hypothetical protein TrispH2_007982 [Trichoplax sp. H2]|nr:hypothetical protein TrispH2_007982 [Trichoplax sp. H2]|eukprot:RDD40137.1 hypothetical protein TrispH2_007982 [Trichoplax sp. H2]